MSRRHPTAKEFLGSADPAIEQGFLSRVMLPSGAFMTTDCNRLADVNTFLMLRLPPRDLDIMDVAVSSGVTTAEMARIFRKHRVVATDIMPSATLVRGFRGFEVLIDESRNVLHFDIGGFGFSPSKTTVLRPLKTMAIRIFKALDKPSLPSKKVKLSNGVKVLADNIFAPNPPEWRGRFDVIRAANILNLSYFPADRIQAGITTLKERMKDGALLVIARTVAQSLVCVQTNHIASMNDATLFRLEGGRLSIVSRLNNGSEVEKIALSA